MEKDKKYTIKVNDEDYSTFEIENITTTVGKVSFGGHGGPNGPNGPGSPRR